MSMMEQRSSSPDIDTMPLTRVSIEHDTAALYDRLQRALGRIGLQDDELIQASIHLGMALHQEDARSYETYNNHLLRVTLRLIETLRVTDRVAIAAAPLHDSIEDHPDVLARMYLDIEPPDDEHITRALGTLALHRFGLSYDAPQLAGTVLDVSNPILEPEDNKNSVYTDHVTDLMDNGPIRSVIVKIADVLDNVEPPPGNIEDPDKRIRMDLKQEPIYDIVRRGLNRTGGVVRDDVRQHVQQLLATKHKDARRRIKRRPSNRSI